MTRAIEIVAAVIRDHRGHVLTVRKRETGAFMLPGGKRQGGEDDLAALARELREELGSLLIDAEHLGTFDAPAANEPDTRVYGAIYLAKVDGEPRAQAEIEELRWVPLSGDETLRLAPLLERQVLPRLRDREFQSETK